MSRYAVLVGWGSYFSIKPGEIKKLNVALGPGEEPPEYLHRHGIRCKRVGINRERMFVVYAGLTALDDIRTLVQLVQEMEGVYADAEAEARQE